MNGDVLHKNTENSLTMAAGSDPQPVESSVVPDHGLVPANALTRISGVRNHIPYSDHNYGKPLTPPDSCSPEHPEEADTGNEEEGFTRCICGYKHDDGYMICCDKCSAWQHIECVGIKGNSVPDTYLCDVCDPRPLDKERAKQIQAKKREEPTDEEDEEDGDVSDHDSDNGLPSQPNLPNPSSIKENILTKGKRKKRETTRKLGQKEMKHNKRKRRKRKHISPDGLPVDEDTNGAWSLSNLPSSERYDEAQKTVYIGDLLKQSFQLSEPQITNHNLTKNEQLCKVVEVQKNKQGVVVTEDTSGDQFIIECCGILMPESKFKELHPLFPKCYPFVLYYTKLDHLRLVMDFSTYGNDARFIRRSCSPTAQVRHVVIDNQIRLIVVSTTPLAKGSEVTVGFEFPFQEYRRQLDCACAQDNCAVQKHNSAIQSIEQTNGFRGKDEHGLPLLDGLNNQMDSDSDGDNSNDANDKRNRKKLSREDRKLQAYLRQIEKMEKTEKKRQQNSGREGRTGILTQRNFGDEYNCDNTPPKPGKPLRKQCLNQKRKVHQIVRRGSRLTSCSSEPHSPEDNYSSAASTPTTPLVNVVEEHNEVHHHDTPEKSFKFPKFKKGSLNDVSLSNGDQGLCNSASPETEYTTPCKPSPYDSRLLEVEVSDRSFPNCERLPNLEQTCNGSTSPRTDPNSSLSPCHSSYASPTHSENVDLHDQSSRHCSASPISSSVASYLLNERHHKPGSLHTTLKKRWLLKYMSEQGLDKRPNGLLPSTVGPLNGIVKPSTTSRTFPLPYKRRKLVEYQNFVNNQTRTSLVVSETPSSKGILTVVSAVVASCARSAHTNVTSATSLGEVKDPLVPRDRQRTASCSEDASSGRSSLSSISSTEDMKMDIKFSEVQVDRPSKVDSSTEILLKPATEVPLKPISRTDVAMRSNTDNQLKSVSSTQEPLKSSTDGSLSVVTSTDVQSKSLPVDRLSSASASSTVLQESSVEPSTTNCVMLKQGYPGTSRDTVANVGSSVDGTGNSTTAGGKKKVSLSEYRKRTSINKKESTPGHSPQGSSPSQSRVSQASNLATSSRDGTAVLSVSSYQLSSSLNNYATPTLSSCVISSTGGSLIEPVSPDESYNGDDERPALNSTSQDQRPAHVVREAKPSIIRDPYFDPLLMRQTRPISEPGSSSDAMDIDEDETPSSSTILVNTPVMAGPASLVSRSQPCSSSGKSYPQHDPAKLNNISPGQSAVVAQSNESLMPPEAIRRRTTLVPSPRLQNPSVQSLPRHQDFVPGGGRPSPYH